MRPGIRIILALSGWLLAGTAASQSLGNEWISFNQQYFKMPVAMDGIYRISYEDLQNAGFPVGTVNPSHLQLFHRGEEMAIHVETQDAGQMAPGDYLLFYGQKNDGTVDEDLYLPQEAQPHQLYNLFSDTTFYFLTWRLDGLNGKRIPDFSEPNADNLPAEAYHRESTLSLQVDQYSSGLIYPPGLATAETQNAHFDYGEGWTGTLIRKDQSLVFTLDSLVSGYISGPPPVIRILMAGRNYLRHNSLFEVGPDVSSFRILGNLEFERQYNAMFVDTLEWSDISGADQLAIRVTSQGFPEFTVDNVSVSYLQLDFPQEFDQAGRIMKKYNLLENISGKSYVEIYGINNPWLLWDITDPYNITNIGYETTAGGISAVIPNTNTARTLLNTEAPWNITSISRVRMRAINPGTAEYVLIYHPDFTRPAGSYSNPVKAYAAYRASPEGGGFDTLTVNVTTLYDQYSYGEYSPVAIRNFCRHITDQGDPRFLLLVGKGLTVNYGYYRGKQVATQVKDWIPTAGYPGSDVLFTAGLNGSSYGQGIPTGRITAKTPIEVANYLDKIKEAELFNFDDLWKKDLIQLSGGISAEELVTFRSYINEFKAVEEDLYLGGNTLNVYKESNNSVELINISEEVNKGKNMILFFGHSAPSIIDIDIGYVSDPALGYNNRGKYPFIYVNGCDAGNIFTPSMSLGEDWIVTAQKGGIGFFAHSDVGYTSQLKQYSDMFLESAFADSSFIHQPLGIVLQETAARFLDVVAPSERNIAQVQQNILQGDPAMRLFGTDRPDYSISVDEISIVTQDDEPITTLTDSFDIAMIVRNFGRADEKPFYVAVTRSLPDGTAYQLDPELFNPVFYKDTLYFTVDNTIEGAFGLNQFNIVLDPFDSISEIRKTNNRVNYNYFLPRLGTQNLFPYNYSIVDASPEQLVTQATDILGDARQFQFELDTVPDFNSPVRLSYSITRKGIATWEPDLFQQFPRNDSTVFFWRSKFSDVLPGEEDSWSTYSFLYIENGPEGWAQKSTHQLLENTFEGLTFSRATGKWEFATYETSIDVTTYGANHPDKTYEDVTLYLNGIPYIYNTRLCTSNSINAVAFDQVTTNPYLVLRFGRYDILDRRSCGRQPQTINNFLNSEITGSSDYLSSYIDAVKPGDHVLIFSIGNVAFSTWTQDIKNKLIEIGASSAILENLNDGDPLIILGQKGAPEGSAVQLVADPSSGVAEDEQEISLTERINGFSTSGRITSPRIGPARSWNTFYHQTGGVDDPAYEDYSFQITGINQNNAETILQSGITATDLDISGINAEVYPYLRVQLMTMDTTRITPAQLKGWLVTYDPMPEGILYPDAEQPTSGIEKNEGEIVEADFIFHNISDKDFGDSIQVIYGIFNIEGRFRRSDSLLVKPLAARELQKFQISFNTLGMVGENDVDVVANPNIIPERYFNNNYLNMPGFMIVLGDNANPVLDVAFDGRYILDGDIVPPSPLISIKVKDDNEFLRKTDTTGVEIMIKPPCEGCFFRRIAFSDPGVTWSPATDKSDFSVEYKPPPFDDGIYTLKVQASDASGNLSGTEPYQIRFEVINESQITNFYPYPNPFSSSTRFVFTLTGSVIPDQFKIQILTISGKVVREITQDEIGPIHIGNNITEYAWDGRDEYGDQLANGVYLYRVLLNSPEEEFKHRSTFGDRGFTNGFGKLYLLR